MPLPQPAPLPEYVFDYSHSEDDNFLTWVTVLARQSFSRKGHMAAMIVRPPLPGSYDPRTSSAPSSSSSAPSSATPTSRVVVYANNYPINYVQNAKAVSEVHAETHCIALAARHGKSIEGCTLYVTFPPCNECSRVILAAGIKRCVFRKGMTRDKNEQILVAAAANGMEMLGTSAVYKYLPSLAMSEQKSEDVPSAGPVLPSEEDLPSLLQAEREADDAREASAKVTWDRNGDTAQGTRVRVDDFWKDWLQGHQAVAKKLEEDWATWEAIERKGKERDGLRWMGKLSEQGKRSKRGELSDDAKPLAKEDGVTGSGDGHAARSSKRALDELHGGGEGDAGREGSHKAARTTATEAVASL